MIAYMALVLEVLALSTEGKFQEELLWTTTDDPQKPIKFMIDCVDVFTWAVPDGIEVTEETLPVLRETTEEVLNIMGTSGGFWIPVLFAARVRGSRPQKALYLDLAKPLWTLFDSCGPEHETGS